MSAEQQAEEVERGPDDEATAAGMAGETPQQAPQPQLDPFALAAYMLGVTFESLQKAPHAGKLSEKIAFAHAAAAFGHALAARDQLIIMVRAEQAMQQEPKQATGLLVPR